MQQPRIEVDTVRGYVEAAQGNVEAIEPGLRLTRDDLDKLAALIRAEPEDALAWTSRAREALEHAATE
jgi:hypothetical protein